MQLNTIKPAAGSKKAGGESSSDKPAGKNAGGEKPAAEAPAA